MFDWLSSPLVTTLMPIATFFLGFFASRWSMTKKEAADVEQKLFENSKQLKQDQSAAYQEFIGVFQKYINNKAPPSFDDFVSISGAIQKYIFVQTIVSDAVLTGKVDRQSRDGTFVPSITRTVKENLPSSYRALKNIAKKNGFEYGGELKRENYESLYAVVEKYGNLDDASKV